MGAKTLSLRTRRALRRGFFSKAFLWSRMGLVARALLAPAALALVVGPYCHAFLAGRGAGRPWRPANRLPGVRMAADAGTEPPLTLGRDLDASSTINVASPCKIKVRRVWPGAALVRLIRGSESAMMYLGRSGKVREGVFTHDLIVSWGRQVIGVGGGGGNAVYRMVKQNIVGVEFW
jgi:hypothetical protein